MSDNQTKPKHMSADTAAAKFADILKWRLQPATPHPTLSAVRYDRDRITGTPSSTRLPFPIDTITADNPTAAGVETTAGIHTWIELWGAWLTWALDLTPRKIDGAWLLSVLQDNPDLHPLPDPKAFADDEAMSAWATGFLIDWDRFTHELTRLWWKIGDTTGNTPLRRGLCPRCKTGYLHSEVDERKGFADEATCTNRKCGIQIDYHKEEVANSVRAALRGETVSEDTYLTLNEIRTIWPRIKESTLRWWVHQGHVRKQGGLYCLADINARMWTRTP